MSNLSGNKGEWSEIYVFLRLLEIGKLYAADSELNKIDNVFYNILNIIRDEDHSKLEFRINKDANTVSIVKIESDLILNTLPFSVFKQEADNLYERIVSSNAPSFSLEQTEEFLSSIHVNTIKAKSSDKADIKIKIHDINTGINSVQGFSIKSRLGSASSLINAGKTTNFIFEVTGPMTDEVMDEFNTCSKLFRNRFAVLNMNNCDIIYYGMENCIFENNLRLIDGDLPEICAAMLKTFYSNGVSKTEEALFVLVESNPKKYNLSNGHPFYHYKFKKLLTECALGMLPSKTWDGTADATGGYIIVREDGEVLCYHLFNRNEFENYLLKNTKFETGSTRRHEFGFIYKKDDKYYIKLNLQVRFIK